MSWDYEICERGMPEINYQFIEWFNYQSALRYIQ